MKTNLKKVCPKCGSTNVDSIGKSVTIFGQEIRYICKNCYYGYRLAGFFPELNHFALKKFRKKIRSRLKVKGIEK